MASGTHSTVLLSINHLSGLILHNRSTSGLILNVVTQAGKAKRKVIFKRAESYVKEYLSKEKEEIRLKRASRASGDFYVPAETKIYFVVRIRGYVELPS